MKTSRIVPVGFLGLALGCAHPSDPQGTQAAPVRTARVESGTLTEWVRLYGRVVPPPDRDAALSPLVAGVLTAVPVRAGESVQAGAVLARVDAAPLEDALRAAEAAGRRAAAESDFRRRAASRTRALFDKGVSSRQEAEADDAAAVAADSALAEASAALAGARRRRAWAEVKAPFEGVVVRVLRRSGEVVDGTPATPVVELASTEHAQVAADATAEVLARLAPGQAAEVGPREAVEAVHRARVLRAARAVEAASGAGEVRLALEEPWPGLVLGLGVEVRVAARRKDGAACVSARALRRGPAGRTEAVVVESGKARVRSVTLGLVEGDRVEVVSGLAPGETVVVDDPLTLADGAPVVERP